MRLTVRVDASSPAVAAVVDGAGAADVTTGTVVVWARTGAARRPTPPRPTPMTPATTTSPATTMRASSTKERDRPAAVISKGESRTPCPLPGSALVQRRQCWCLGQEYVVRPPIVRRSSGVPSRGHRPPRCRAACSRPRWLPPAASSSVSTARIDRSSRPRSPSASDPAGRAGSSPARHRISSAQQVADPGDPGLVHQPGLQRRRARRPSAAASSRGRMAKASTPSMDSSGSSSTPPSRRGSLSRSWPPPAKLERRTGPRRPGHATTRTPAPRCPGARRRRAARSSRSAARAPGRRRTCRAAAASPPPGRDELDAPRARRPAPAPSGPA